jgi:methionyl-tRNA formyltransferase
VPVHRVPSLNSEAAIACVRRARPDAVIYSGGGILRSGFLGAAGRVVNAHAGPLPEIRGMNAAEWAALLGLPARVAIHFIDEGIDTGELIQHVDYDRSGCEDIEALRQSAVVAGVEGLVACIDSGAAFAETEPAEGLATVHRQCFVMAPSLQSVLARRLAGSN